MSCPIQPYVRPTYREGMGPPLEVAGNPPGVLLEDLGVLVHEVHGHVDGVARSTGAITTHGLLLCSIVTGVPSC